MKHLLTIALIVAGSATAQPVTVTPGTHDLYTGTRKASEHQTLDECVKAAEARGAGKYGCRTITHVYVEATVPPPVEPSPVEPPPAEPPQHQHPPMVGVPWNPDLLPAPNTSAYVSGDRVRASSIATPVSRDIPIARVRCEWSHFGANDPLVFPGAQDASHLHMFWGNTTTDHSTTNFRSDTSSCTGGAANSTGYWIAALIDTRDGRPLVPDTIFNYYKGGYLGVRPEDFRPWPQGLRMLAGDAMNDRIPESWARRYRWSCSGVSGQHGSIPAGCTPGGELIFEIAFPQCWDGKNLDAPDHKSHMAYANGRGCPASHPHAIPEITYVVFFRTPQTGSSTLRLSSDRPGAPAGTSAHADWWDGWDPKWVQHLISSCHNQNRDCGTNLLGGGLTLY